MIQNFQLQQIRTQVPVTEMQYLPKFLAADEIDYLIKQTEDFDFHSGDIVGEGVYADTVVRRSQIKWLEWQKDNAWIFEKLMSGIQTLNAQCWNFDLFGINEPLQYTEYLNTEDQPGFYDWHLDVSNEGLASNRKLSFECMLDDTHSGGEFSLSLGPSEYKVKLQKGDAVVFPSFLQNKTYPVQVGIRKSLVGWVAGPSFR